MDNQLKFNEISFRDWSSNIYPFYTPEIEINKEGLLFRRFVENFGCSRQYKEIYNDWIDNFLEKQLLSKHLNLPFGKIKIDRPRLEKPIRKGTTENLTPKMARDIGHSYLGNLYVRITFEPNTDEHNEFSTEILFGQLLVMLGSKYCHTFGKSTKELLEMGECPGDPLGYWIIKGGEKHIIIQEKLRNSQPIFYFNPKTGILEGRYTCYTHGGTSLVLLKVGKKFTTIKVKLKHSDKHLPLYVLFAFLGFDPTDATNLILKYVKAENRFNVEMGLQISIEKFISKKDYISYWARKRKLQSGADVLIHDINNELFNNIPTVESTPELYDEYVRKLKQKNPNINFIPPQIPQIAKAKQLALISARMIETILGLRDPDDRDNWSNNELVAQARSYMNLVGSIYKDMIDNAQKIINESKPTVVDGNLIKKLFNDPSLIGMQSQTSFNSKSWGSKSAFRKENITDSLKRETPISILTANDKINTPTNRRASRMIRGIEPTQKSRVCIADTPEGEQCGLVKSKSVLCYLSMERDTDDIKTLIKESGNYSQKSTDVFKHPFLINGEIYGFTQLSFINVIISERRSGRLPKDCAIINNEIDGTIEYNCNSGRLCNPLLIVENGELVIDKKNMWNSSVDELINGGAVEFVDIREEEFNNYYLAQYPEQVRDRHEQTVNFSPKYSQEIIDKFNSGSKDLYIQQNYLDIQKEILTRRKLFKQQYTHSDIKPISIYGLAAGLMPDAGSSPGPRVTYQCSMAKQSPGPYHTKHYLRFDAGFKMLNSPARCIYESELSQPIGYNIMPSGQNVMIAVYSDPLNMEDAIIASEAFLEENLEIIKYFTIKSSKQLNQTFKKPIVAIGEQVSKYNAIDEHGIPIIGKYVKKGDCIIGKVRHVPENDQTSNMREENISEFLGVGQDGFIEAVYIGRDSDNAPCIKVKIGILRKQKVGDKLASRCSQKGTIGDVRSLQLMPKIIEGPNKGVRPDIIINACFMPSRMTGTMLKEILSSKAAVFEQLRVNGTTFHKFNNKFYEDILEKHGMDRYGNEKMENPDKTKPEVDVFFGVCTYQALRHHVDDKIQLRDRGPAKPLTHQPVEGRSQEGGLRLGEMERDAMISHGSSAILNERLMRVSDKYRTVYCTNCGNLAISNSSGETMKITCRICSNKESNFGTVTMPYVMKLIYHMLLGCGINISFNLTQQVPNGSSIYEKYLH